MKKIYTLFLMDQEPESRSVGEFGHDIIGVYEDVACAIKAIEDRMRSTKRGVLETFLITETTFGGTSFDSKEVFKSGYLPHERSTRLKK